MNIPIPFSSPPAAPGGLSWARFKAVATEVGGWVWGTAQGAFNHKATTAQIITDAVIGMIPLVGDATAVRDLIAVSIGLVEDPKKREDVWQWVFLVVLVCALIPVIGGVIKGVGRLIIKVVGEMARVAGHAERAARLLAAGKNIIEMLNRVGVGNAEKWLLKLKFADHQAAILERFKAFTTTVIGSIVSIEKKMHAMLPQSMLTRAESLKIGFEALAKKADEMIPKAIKELDSKLREIQEFIRSGGETTSRATQHVAASGEKALSYTEELRLLEQGSGAIRSPRGGWAQNKALVGLDDAKVKAVYHEEAGFPRLLEKVSQATRKTPAAHTYITTYAGKITNRVLHEDEEVFRIFGPEGLTHGVPVGKSYPVGRKPPQPNAQALSFWGLGPPKHAREWRETSAVLDEWNHDGFIITGKVTKKARVKACTGKIAEQRGKDLAGQYLPGGGQQAIFELSENAIEVIGKVSERVIKTGKARKCIVDGIEFTIRPTGWTDVNGLWGYLRGPGEMSMHVAQLGVTEKASKEEQRHAEH